MKSGASCKPTCRRGSSIKIWRSKQANVGDTFTPCPICQDNQNTGNQSPVEQGPGAWYKSHSRAQPVDAQHFSCPCKWRTPPKWKYKRVNKWKKAKKLMPQIEFTHFGRSCVGPKSDEGWCMQRQSASSDCAALSVRVEHRPPLCSGPPYQLETNQATQAGNSGKSKEDPVHATIIMPGRIWMTCFLFMAQQVQWSTAVHTPHPMPTLSTDLSRSCRRAVRRAEAQGCTWYRGRWCTINNLKVQYRGNQAEKVFSRPPVQNQFHDYVCLVSMWEACRRMHMMNCYTSSNPSQNTCEHR